jgi:hypothetical protein
MARNWAAKSDSVACSAVVIRLIPPFLELFRPPRLCGIDAMNSSQFAIEPRDFRRVKMMSSQQA